MTATFPRPTLTALTWLFGAIAAALTAGRYAIRYRTAKRFQADDVLHGLALIFLICMLATYNANFDNVYAFETYMTVEDAPLPPVEDWHRYIRIQLANVELFWCTLFGVKAAFLALYWQLFSVSRKFVRAWWAVSGLTLVAFLVCFVSPFWWCGTPSILFTADIEECYWSDALDKVFKMWCGLNVGTDIAIMILPLWMLSRMQMPKSYKMGLSAIFLLGVIIIAFDITRTVYTVYGEMIALDALWDIMEACIAVIVSCLPTYGPLVSRRHRDPKVHEPVVYRVSDHSDNSGKGMLENEKALTLSATVETRNDSTSAAAPRRVESII